MTGKTRWIVARDEVAASDHMAGKRTPFARQFTVEDDARAYWEKHGGVLRFYQLKWVGTADAWKKPTGWPAHDPRRCPSNHYNDGRDFCRDCGRDLQDPNPL